MARNSVLCVGDAMLDIVVKHGGRINLNSDSPSQNSLQSGGAAANTAAWLTQVNVDSHFSGKIGKDLAGEKLISDLQLSGVTCHISKDSIKSTGTVVVLVDSDGNRTMFPDSGANAGLDSSIVPVNKEFDGYFISGYALFNDLSSSFIQDWLRDLRAGGKKIFIDPASVGLMSEIGSSKALGLIGKVDIIFVNEDEAKFLNVRELIDLAPIIVIKRGALGASVITNDGIELSKPAMPATVLDTTGAGDAFAAGFIAEWLRSKDLSAALDLALSLAAKCVSNIGARPRVIT